MSVSIVNEKIAFRGAKSYLDLLFIIVNVIPMINCNAMIDRGMKVINFPIILNVESSGSKKNIPKNRNRTSKADIVVIVFLILVLIFWD